MSTLNQKQLNGTMFSISRILGSRNQEEEEEGMTPLTIIPIDPPQQFMLSNTPCLNFSGLEKSVSRIKKLPSGDVA